MTVSDDVMEDLLTVYLAGEASAGTKALVQAYAREHAAFAERLRASLAFALPGAGLPAGPPPDHQLLALRRTREFIRLRTIFTAGAILFTLLPLVFTFGSGGVQFLILGRHPGLMWSFWSLAAASWAACYVMHRRVRQAGL
ncbi:MAG: hypothetical protein R6V57_15435 [Vicinamibacterales bacterium]